MQIKDVRPQTFVKQIRCDRCDRLAEVGGAEFQEFISIDLKAGYASIFGDGCDVQLDLCQHCLKASLGPWLRISDADDRQRQLEGRLSQFDRDRHGGEFPAVADASLQGRPGREPLERSETAGAWIPADLVIAKLEAKVHEARTRRSVGFLKGRFEVPPDFDGELPGDLIQDFEGSATKDSKLAMFARMQDDLDVAQTSIDRAIELAHNGEHELAKRILCNLLGIGVMAPLSSQELGQASNEQSASPPYGADAAHRSGE